MLIKLRQFILRSFKPFIQAVGGFKIGSEGIDLDEKYNMLRDGDVIVSRRDWVVSNIFISGYWKHAGIVFVDGDLIYIIEAKNKGVSKTLLSDFLKNKTQIRTQRSLFATKRQSEEATIISLSLLGKPYDFAIMSTNDAFYCSEVIWYSFDKVLSPSIFEPRLTMGVRTVTPMDIVLATKKWSELFSDSRKA